jgi:hypothetical protein
MKAKPFSTTPPELRAEFTEAVLVAMSGQRDPEVMRVACEHMDRLREEIRRQHGIQNIGVDLIRELRGELPELGSASSISRWRSNGLCRKRVPTSR